MSGCCWRTNERTEVPLVASDYHVYPVYDVSDKYEPMNLPFQGPTSLRAFMGNLSSNDLTGRSHDTEEPIDVMITMKRAHQLRPTEAEEPFEANPSRPAGSSTDVAPIF